MGLIQGLDHPGKREVVFLDCRAIFMVDDIVGDDGQDASFAVDLFLSLGVQMFDGRLVEPYRTIRQRNYNTIGRTGDELEDSDVAGLFVKSTPDDGGDRRATSEKPIHRRGREAGAVRQRIDSDAVFLDYPL